MTSPGKKAEKARNKTGLGRGSDASEPQHSRPAWPPDFLQGEGEMCQRIREHRWEGTPMGTPDRWPAALVSTLSICLTARFPIAIYWGTEGFLFYNDAWRPILGDKHPWALGQPALQVWPEIWEAINPLFETVRNTARGTWRGDELLPMKRFGYTEECYFDYTFNPIRGESGKVEGILNIVQETTFRVLNERRNRLLAELASCSAVTPSELEACKLAMTVIATDAADIPFALLYHIGRDERDAKLFAATGLPEASPARIAQVNLHTEATDEGWPLGGAYKSAKAITVPDLERRFGPVAGGAWPEPVNQAIILPITSSGSSDMAALLVLGISPRRPMDENYRRFVELVASHFASTIANARAYEQERRRAETLAELDRAKTAFFSNVSHEFRTPLTLMLGPLEALKARFGHTGSNISTAEYQQIDLVHRNGLRLLKLVNTLLDFSRIEAGRTQAVFEETDLATLTSELASLFRSTIENAGLKLLVDCPPLPEAVYVDREMWEKIVLNMLSNAFKFTFEGAIEVKLQASGKHAELCVQDSGIGIPSDQIGRIFERFHRVPGAQGRTYEGTGIGLALVQELARLHGGSVSVESEYGKGTIFHVFIPFGKGHLLQKDLGVRSHKKPTSLSTPAFIEEASHWLPDAPRQAVRPLTSQDSEKMARDPQAVRTTTKGRILLADDNADMRDYIRRLLEEQGYEANVAPDGEAALALARKEPPDLLLSDVMMPKLDGIGLVNELRADQRFRTLPIILLSARAGEESRVEGVVHGADDYLTKPFSAQELLARIATHLSLAQVRREAENRVIGILESLTDGFQVVDASGRVTYMNSAARRMLAEQGLKVDEAIGKHIIDEIFPASRETEFAKALHQAINQRSTVAMELFYKPWQRWYAIRLYPNPNAGVAIYFQDITERKRAEEELSRRLTELERANEEIRESRTAAVKLMQEAMDAKEALRRSQERFDIVKEAAQVGFWFCDLPFDKLIWDPRVKEHFWLPPDAEVTIDTFYRGLHAQDRERTRLAIEKSIQERGRYDIEYRTVSAAGQEKWIRAIGHTFYDSGGNPIRFDGVTIDITASKLAEERLEKTVSERTVELKQTIGELEAFSYSVSHDLRAPLRAMQGYSEELLQEASDSLSPTHRTYLERINRAALRLDRLTQEVLTYSRLSREEISLHRVDLAKLLEEIIEQYPHIKSSEINVQSPLLAVIANEAFLTQAVSNLLTNAVKFVQPGARPKISVRTELIGTEVRLWVEDRGIGIEPQHRERIFQIFGRVHPESKYEGTGIGLSIVKKAVERMNGRVGFTSEPREGSQFWIDLPHAQ